MKSEFRERGCRGGVDGGLDICQTNSEDLPGLANSHRADRGALSSGLVVGRSENRLPWTYTRHRVAAGVYASGHGGAWRSGVKAEPHSDQGENFTWDCALPPGVSDIGVSTRRGVPEYRASWLAGGLSVFCEFHGIYCVISCPVKPSRDRLVAYKDLEGRGIQGLDSPWGGEKHVKMNSRDCHWREYLSL